MKPYYDKQEHSSEWHSLSEQFTYVNGLGFLPETPRQKERKQLVLQYNALMFLILLFYFLRVAVTLPVIRFLLILGFDVQINPETGMVTLSEQATQWGGIFCSLITYGIPIMMAWFLLKRVMSTGRIFALPYSGISFYGIFIILGASFVASLASFLFTKLMELGGLSLRRAELEIPTSLSAFILLLLANTLLEAFLEELLFRGLILNSMRRFGDIIAIFVSATLYALVQPSIDEMIYGFVMGLVLSYFALRSGSFILPFLGSFFVKGVNMFFWMLEEGENDVRLIFMAVAIFLLSLAAVIAFLRFVLKDPHAFRVFDRETNLTNRTKLKYFLTNIGFWMIVVLFFFQAIKNIEIIN